MDDYDKILVERVVMGEPDYYTSRVSKEMSLNLGHDVGEIWTQLDRMKPKLDSTVARVDDHGVRLKRLEDRPTA